MTNTYENEYKVGSLAWIERSRYNTVRRLLEYVMEGVTECEPETRVAHIIKAAREDLYAFDTDSASS